MLRNHHANPPTRITKIARMCMRGHCQVWIVRCLVVSLVSCLTSVTCVRGERGREELSLCVSVPCVWASLFLFMPLREPLGVPPHCSPPCSPGFLTRLPGAAPRCSPPRSPGFPTTLPAVPHHAPRGSPPCSPLSPPREWEPSSRSAPKPRKNIAIAMK